MWGQLSTLCTNVLKQSNGELLVAVKHNQLRTMASETVDAIDWLHPPPSWAVPPECLMHNINQCNLSGNRTCNRSIRGNHLAYVETWGFQHLPQERRDITVGLLYFTINVLNLMFPRVLKQSPGWTALGHRGWNRWFPAPSWYHSIMETQAGKENSGVYAQINQSALTLMKPFTQLFLFELQHQVSAGACSSKTADPYPTFFALGQFKTMSSFFMQ